MSYDHAWELLYLAVRTLATETGTIRPRLEHAFLNMAHLQEKELPADLVPKFRAIESALTTATLTSGEGSIAATVRQLRDDEAKEIAEQIVHMFIELQGHEKH